MNEKTQKRKKRTVAQKQASIVKGRKTVAKGDAAPAFTKRERSTFGTEYVSWIGEVKKRFRQMQAKAIVRVNRAMLEFYWSLGRDLAERKELSKYGDAIVANASFDLRAEFPDVGGFSEVNIWRMKRWFLFYNQKQSQAGTVLKTTRKLSQAGTVLPTNGKGRQPGDFYPDETFFSVPWRHHVEIIQHCSTADEGLFYIRKTVEEGWSRRELGDFLDARLYLSQGRAQTNFAARLPEELGRFAQEALKDPYNFGFLSLCREYDERQLENALMDNVERFLMELGKGFALVGRQMELKMPDGTSYFPDLIFYHTRMHCYVVVELKVVKFEPEHAGKLNFYVTAADRLLKCDGDNPTIGLLICKSKDKTTVEWSLADVNKPLGVAAYELERLCESLDISTH